MEKLKSGLYDCFNAIDEIIGDSINNALLISGDIYANIFENSEPDITNFESDYKLHQVKMHIVWKETLETKKRLQQVSDALWKLYEKSGISNNINNEDTPLQSNQPHKGGVTK